MDLLKLLHGFVRVVLCISCTLSQRYRRKGGGRFPLCIKNPHLELFSLPQRYFTSQYKRPPIDDFVELIIENLEKWIWANQDGKEAWRWGKKAWRRCRNGDWDHQGGIQHWDKQTNVIENPKHGILCLEHEPYCCQSKWCWPVGCKQKLGGLSLNHLRPEVEWRSYFWQKQCRWWIHYFGTLLYMLLLQPIMTSFQFLGWFVSFCSGILTKSGRVFCN